MSYEYKEIVKDIVNQSLMIGDRTRESLVKELDKIYENERKAEAWNELKDRLEQTTNSDETKEYLKPFYQGFLDSMDDVYKESEAE